MVTDAPLVQRRLGEVVRRQLHGRAHRGPKHGGIDAASEALDAFLPDNVDQSVQCRGVVVLCADGVERRVGLHAGFDEEEGVSENGCARPSD